MTAALSQSGQRTPCGQRCWRTRSKHLASSSSAERLTNSDTAMMTASSSNQDEILGPSNRMSSATATPPAITTPKPDKSLFRLAEGSAIYITSDAPPMLAAVQPVGPALRTLDELNGPANARIDAATSPSYSSHSRDSLAGMVQLPGIA